MEAPTGDLADAMKNMQNDPGMLIRNLNRYL